MSVIVDIKINARLVATYSISRTTRELSELGVNIYRVERHFPDTRPNQGDKLVTLHHAYDDSIESLVAKAIPLAEAEFGTVPRTSRS